MRSSVLSGVLVIVGIILLGVVISLQMSILSDEQSAFARIFGSATSESEVSTTGASAATVSSATSVAMATNTPMVIVVQPTPTLPLSDATDDSEEAGATDVSADAGADADATVATEPSSVTQAAVAIATGGRALAVSSAPAIEGDRLLAAHRITTSADDHVLVDMVSNDPYAVGFVSHATYEERADLVRVVSLPATDGSGMVQPEPNLVVDETYPLSYPLYLYTSANALRAQPEVAGFLGCYLSRVYTDAELVGLYPPSIADFAVAIATFTGNTGIEPTCNAADLPATTLSVMTASSLVPLTQRIGGAFRGAGFVGGVEIQTRETSRSAQLFCTEGLGDVIAVSRALYEEEVALCDSSGRELVSFEIAKDALTVVVSNENDFLYETNLSELQLLFAEGDVWSNVHVGWPTEPIARAVPSDQSGGFAKFASAVFNANVPQLAMQFVPPTPTADPNAAGNSATADAATTTTEGAAEIALDAAVVGAGTTGLEEAEQLVVAGVQGRAECTALASVVAQVLETTYGKSVSLVTAADTDELFDRLAWDVADPALQVDISPCYTDLGDRTYLRDKGSAIAMMHNIYGRIGDDKLYMIAHSSVPPVLRSEDLCVYEFFRQVAVEDMTIMRGQEPAAWLAQNGDLVAEWTACSQ